MIFCRKCGTQLPDESIFCSKCGSAITFTESIPPVSPYTPPPYGMLSSLPVAGGILIILGAVFCLISALICLIFLSYRTYYDYYGDIYYSYCWTAFIAGVFGVIAFAFGLVGGICAIRRMRYILAIIFSVFVIVGAVFDFMGTMIFGIISLIFGILGVIFIAISKSQFRS